MNIHERMSFMKKPSWWDEFMAFAVKGNAMALAVGTIIGAAFGTITKSLTDDIIMPVIAIFTGDIDFSDIVIPEVLRKYMGGIEVIEPKK